MKTKLKADLEKRINDFIAKHCEDDELRSHTDNWRHQGLSEEMATAAELVFDAAQKAQDFARENK
jgi:hypothetical protein